MGDVIYDLRSALDHLAWQLVIANGGTPVTPEDNAGPSTAFPIFHSKEGAKGGPRPPVSIAGGVNTAALAVIERLQPYHRVDDPQLDPLWQLSELCNTDKHRLLLVVGVTYDALVTTTNGKISTTRMQEPIPLIIGRWVSAIGFHSYEDAVALQVDVEPTTLIAFSEGEPGAGHAVSEVLLDLTNMVEGIVDDLAPFVR
jgi:hypothetical protein